MLPSNNKKFMVLQVETRLYNIKSANVCQWRARIKGRSSA